MIHLFPFTWERSITSPSAASDETSLIALEIPAGLVGIVKLSKQVNRSWHDVMKKSYAWFLKLCWGESYQPLECAPEHSPYLGPHNDVGIKDPLEPILDTNTMISWSKTRMAVAW